jgi:FkbM family methyltransferase
MREYLKPGDIAFDVGANVGWHSLALASIVGPRGRVLAFEPAPVDRALLAVNIAANHYKNIEIYESAVTDFVGQALFTCFRSPGVHHLLRDDSPSDGEVFEVPTITLDSVAFDRNLPSFLKIDVEGGEYKVLMGARRLLVERRPVIVAEVRRGLIWDDVASLVTPLGYDIHELHGDKYLADVLLLPARRLPRTPDS